MEKRSKAVAKVLKATTKKNHFGHDFQYVVKRPVKAKICFGSTVEKKQSVERSRFGVEHTHKPNDKLYPGKYLISAPYKTSRPTSIKGTVIGGRTAVRQVDTPLADYPGPSPSTYKPYPPLSVPTPSFKGSQRFKSSIKRANVGPGYYKVGQGERKIAFAYSLGGKRYIIPPIQMKCLPVNPDTCEKCGKQPIGDYFSFTPELIREDEREDGAKDRSNIHLCRACYEKERKLSTIFNKTQFQQLKKVRDCSYVHFHDGCEARLLLIPPRDILKIQEKEAYLSLYFR